MGYFLYNKYYLSYNFGSIYLSSPNTGRNFTDFLKALIRIITHKSWYYGTIIHYFLVAFIAFKFLQTKKISKNIFLIKNFQNYLIIVFFGMLCYFILMIKQFAYHDYYILDTFFPITIIFCAMGVTFLLSKKTITINRLSLIVICVSALLFNRLTNWFDISYRENRSIEMTFKTFENSYQILDSLKIDKQAKILVLNASGSNLSLIGLQRKGYSIVNDSYQHTDINEPLNNWNYDYIVTQNNTFKKYVLDLYPNFINETNVLFKNDKFTIHTKK